MECLGLLLLRVNNTPSMVYREGHCLHTNRDQDILRRRMANILYGVNGEGAGHSTRAKEVLAHLVAQGHNVRVASFDRGLQNLKTQFDVTEIYGFRFAYVNNRVRYKRTNADQNLSPSRSRQKHFPA